MAQTGKVVHIVLFKLRADLAKEEVEELCNNMLSLRTQCIHPESKQPYILTSSGGKDNSPEGMQGGLTHGFVVEFASAQDRDYYVKEDPAHQGFVRSLGDKVLDVKVLDYMGGVY